MTLAEDLDAGLRHHQSGRFAEAEAQARAILAARPDQGAALYLLGAALLAQGQAQEALAAFDRALARHPHQARIHNDRGLALSALDRTEAAADAFRAALALAPDFLPARINLGEHLRRLGRLDEARPVLEQAAIAAPEMAAIAYNLGCLELDAGRPAEAEAALRRAVALDPALAPAWNNLGCALRDQGRLDAVRPCFERALALSPGFAEAENNLGRALADAGDPAAAIPHYRTTLGLAPDHGEAAWNLALALLASGRIQEGWEWFPARWRRRRVAARSLRDGGLPPWRDERPQGLRLWVWGEQGLGDEILFSSCLPDLVERGAEVTLECDPRLAGLFARSFPAVTVAGREAGPPALPEPRAVRQCPLGDLPARFRPDLAAFARSRPWLTADPAAVEGWRQRLAALGPGLKVGLCWRSAVLSRGRAANYAPLAAWKKLLAVPGAVFVNLQYDARAGELEELLVGERRVHPMAGLDLWNDLDGTAALIAALDLVIAAPTVIGEMAGALGRPVWRLGRIRHWSCLGTPASPWMPTMRCPTALDHGGWDGLLAHAAAELERRITAHAGA